METLIRNSSGILKLTSFPVASAPDSRDSSTCWCLAFQSFSHPPLRWLQDESKTQRIISHRTSSGSAVQRDLSACFHSIYFSHLDAANSFLGQPRALFTPQPFLHCKRDKSKFSQGGIVVKDKPLAGEIRRDTQDVFLRLVHTLRWQISAQSNPAKTCMSYSTLKCRGLERQIGLNTSVVFESQKRVFPFILLSELAVR